MVTWIFTKGLCSRVRRRVPESDVADQAVPLEGNFLQFSWVKLQASRSLRDGSWDLS